MSELQEEQVPEEMDDAQEDTILNGEEASEESLESEELEQEDEEIEEESELEVLQKQLTLLEEENSSLKDQYLRKQADFENYRKRMIREREDSVKYGNVSLLTDLVEVIDNFERAIKSGEESSDFQSFHDGIVMIEQQFSNMLSSKYSLEKLQADGEEYDPNCHEALMMEESDQLKVPTVLQVFQSGYKLHDRILRPAKVKMGKPSGKTETESDGEDK